MSMVTKVLLDLTQRRSFYAGDLLTSVEILHNVTDTFKRASYLPSSDDVQVTCCTPLHELCCPVKSPPPISCFTDQGWGEGGDRFAGEIS